jgi:hypothetical protein
LNLKNLSDSELLIAAGLLASSRYHTDGFYFQWVCYAKELKRRHLTWKQAKQISAAMVKLTDYPKRGWEKKYERNYD